MLSASQENERGESGELLVEYGLYAVCCGIAVTTSRHVSNMCAHAATEWKTKGEMTISDQGDSNGWWRHLYSKAIVTNLELEESSAKFRSSSFPSFASSKIYVDERVPPRHLKCTTHHDHLTPAMAASSRSLFPSSSSCHAPTFLPPSFRLSRHHKLISLSQMNCQITHVQLR